MVEVERSSNEIDFYLPKLRNINRMLVLSKVGTRTEGKPDVISNKKKLTWWIWGNYEKKNIEDLEKHLRSTGKQREWIICNRRKGPSNGSARSNRPFRFDNKISFSKTGTNWRSRCVHSRLYRYSWYNINKYGDKIIR